MANTAQTLEISGLPALSRIVAAVRRDGTRVVLQDHGQDVAVLAPLPEARPRRRTLGHPTNTTDALWNIVGMAESDGPGDVSLDKYRYLADAYTPRSE
jgi:antitoxin (DNA-binding transcriptional repressor) of toxin-antitoxin stability system